MRCPRCHEEVLLAKVCPYCGEAVVVADGPEDTVEGAGTPLTQAKPNPDEGFRGRTESTTRRPRGPWGTVVGALRYLFDPRVPMMRKAFIVGALIYLISPLDVVPDLLPIFGWLDDAAVAVALWGFLNGEIGRYLGRR